MGAPPSFDVYPDRYLGNTQLFDIEHHGAFWLLMLYQWQNGSIPKSVSDLMKICRVHDRVQWDSVWSLVSDKFVESPDPDESDSRLVNPKMYADRLKAVEKYQNAVARARANGAKGGRPPKPKSVLKTGQKKTHVLEGGRGKGEGVLIKEKKESVELIVEHYRTHHSRARPGDKERERIRARLKDGFSVSDLCDAIDGNHLSPFHCGENDNGQKHHGLLLIMRDSDHVEKFMAVKENPPLANSSRLHSNARAAQEFLAGVEVAPDFSKTKRIL